MSKTNEGPATSPWSDLLHTIEGLPMTPILLAAGGTLLTVGILGVLFSSTPPQAPLSR